MLTQRASTARAPARARHSALSPSQQSRRSLQSRFPVSVAASYHLLADLGVASSADAMQAMMPVLCVSTALGGFLLARSNSSTEAVIAQTPDKASTEAVIAQTPDKASTSTESTEAADNAAEARSWIARWRENVKAKTKTHATPAPKDTPMPSPATNEARILGAKAQLLRYCEDVARGRTATAEDAAAIEELASALESINPNPRPLENPEMLSGRWELKYTTSRSILGLNKAPWLRPRDPIYQIIDAFTSRARNEETVKSGPLTLKSAVDARLVPWLTDRNSADEVEVKFARFELFGDRIRIKAPARAIGRLQTTYLDDDLRISRGDRGNLFVLSMVDPNARLAEEIDLSARPGLARVVAGIAIGAATYQTVHIGPAAVAEKATAVVAKVNSARKSLRE